MASIKLRPTDGSGSNWNNIGNAYDGNESTNAIEKKIGNLSFVALTQAEYDALTTKDSNTLYLITG